MLASGQPGTTASAIQACKRARSRSGCLFSGPAVGSGIGFLKLTPMDGDNFEKIKLAGKSLFARTPRRAFLFYNSCVLPVASLL